MGWTIKDIIYPDQSDNTNWSNILSLYNECWINAKTLSLSIYNSGNLIDSYNYTEEELDEFKLQYNLSPFRAAKPHETRGYILIPSIVTEVEDHIGQHYTESSMSDRDCYINDYSVTGIIVNQSITGYDMIQWTTGSDHFLEPYQEGNLELRVNVWVEE